jgi:hypothetical protein
MEGDRFTPRNRHTPSIPCPPRDGKTLARAISAISTRGLDRGTSGVEKLESGCLARHPRCEWHHPSYNRSTFASPRGRFLTGLGPLVESRVTRFFVSQNHPIFGSSTRIRPGQGRREVLAYVVGTLQREERLSPFRDPKRPISRRIPGVWPSLGEVAGQRVERREEPPAVPFADVFRRFASVVRNDRAANGLESRPSFRE